MTHFFAMSAFVGFQGKHFLKIGQSKNIIGEWGTDKKIFDNVKSTMDKQKPTLGNEKLTLYNEKPTLDDENRHWTMDIQHWALK